MHREAEMVGWSKRLLLTVGLALIALIVVQRHVSVPSDSTWTNRANTPSTILNEIQEELSTLFERVSPSVVRVSTIAKSGDVMAEGVRIGSGFFWDSAGHIVTNEHVVRDATIIWVFLASGRDLEAEVVGVAPNYDLAVLRLKQQPDALPPSIPIGTSKDLRVGQFAFTIGSPFALDQSFSVGMVSALKRQLPTIRGREIDDIIQTSAAIYPGNSGGPLVDLNGRLVGVNTLSYGVTNSNTPLGFAIPVDLVSRIVPDLIKEGRVPMAGIGIVPRNDKDALASKGVVISHIRPGSPAERAGLQGDDPANGGIGDVIIKANDATIQSIYDLTNQLERVGIGNRIVLVINRRGERVSVEVEIVDVDRRTW
jgi:2-alkenal reductase